MVVFGIRAISAIAHSSSSADLIGALYVIDCRLMALQNDMACRPKPKYAKKGCDRNIPHLTWNLQK